MNKTMAWGEVTGWQESILYRASGAGAGHMWPIDGLLHWDNCVADRTARCAATQQSVVVSSCRVQISTDRACVWLPYTRLDSQRSCFSGEPTLNRYNQNWNGNYNLPETTHELRHHCRTFNTYARLPGFRGVLTVQPNTAHKIQEPHTPLILLQDDGRTEGRHWTAKSEREYITHSHGSARVL